MDYSQYLISNKASIKDALVAINAQCANVLTLFVLDENERVVGSVTDGDIRRSLIKDVPLNACIVKCMNENFSYIRENNIDVRFIKDIKEKGIRMLPVLDDNHHLCDIRDLSVIKSVLPIDAVLMAGGKGERLRPLTDNTPKPLLKMEGKAIIDYIVEHIISYGIKNISVTVNYLKEQIVNHFRNPFQGVMIKTVQEPKFLGTIGSLSFVKDFQNDTVLLMNSDTITDINLEDFYLHFHEHQVDMSVAAIPYTISVPYGILDLEGRVIKGIAEKPRYNYYANTGIYLIKREILDIIPSGEFYNATDFMEQLIEKGYKVIRFPLNGTWIDIGNPQEYQKAKEFVKHYN